MIKPTVGRKVWYRPSAADLNGEDGNSKMDVNSAEPLDATVVAVWGDRLVNLAIFDIFAKVHERRSVPLLQEGDLIPESGRYAEWMPYQVGQAKKVDAQDRPETEQPAPQATLNPAAAWPFPTR